MKTKINKKNDSKSVEYNDEISLSKLILVLVRHRKLWLILFCAIYFSGLLFYLANKKIIENRVKNAWEKSAVEETIPDEIVSNEVSHGLIWASYRDRDEHVHSTDEVLDYLFNNAELPSLFTKWPGLVCQRTNGIITFLRENKEILRIKINVDNPGKKTSFTTEKLKTKTMNAKLALTKDEINNINDIVVKTYLKEANVRINNYKKVRLQIKKIMSNPNPELNYFNFAAEFNTQYMNLEKEYIQTVVNMYSFPAPSKYNGISVKKFMVIYGIISLFVSLILIYFWEFSRESNLVSEIRKELKGTK